MSVTLGVPVDSEGFLLNREDWSEEVAVALAQNDGFALTEQVMALIRTARVGRPAQTYRLCLRAGR